jgi:hypothetical protein
MCPLCNEPYDHPDVYTNVDCPACALIVDTWVWHRNLTEDVYFSRGKYGQLDHPTLENIREINGAHGLDGDD